MCDNGDLLRSPALLFNDTRLQQELIRERKEKDAFNHINNQNSTTTTNQSTDVDDDKKETVCQSLLERSIAIYVLLFSSRQKSQRKLVHIPKARLIT